MAYLSWSSLEQLFLFASECGRRPDIPNQTCRRPLTQSLSSIPYVHAGNISTGVRRARKQHRRIAPHPTTETTTTPSESDRPPPWFWHQIFQRSLIIIETTTYSNSIPGTFDPFSVALDTSTYYKYHGNQRSCQIALGRSTRRKLFTSE